MGCIEGGQDGGPRVVGPGLLDQGCWTRVVGSRVVGSTVSGPRDAGPRDAGHWVRYACASWLVFALRRQRELAKQSGRRAFSRPCPPRTRGQGRDLVGKCGLAARRSPASVTDAPAPRTFPSPLMHSPPARRGPCKVRPRATRPVSARLSRIATAVSRARIESPSSTGRTVRDARSRSTHAPNLPLNRSRLQTWTDWINEWTCDQGNERTVGSGTIRV